jgi:hypothetical protein
MLQGYVIRTDDNRYYFVEGHTGNWQIRLYKYNTNCNIIALEIPKGEKLHPAEVGSIRHFVGKWIWYNEGRPPSPQEVKNVDLRQAGAARTRTVVTHVFKLH